MINNFHIRTAQRSDAETIAQFNAALARETEHFELDMPRLLRGVNGMFDEPTRGFYLLAQINNEIAGQLMITCEWSDWRNGVFWWIQSVYVVPDARRGGVYRALHAWVERQARRIPGVCGLRLYVDRDFIDAETACRSSEILLKTATSSSILPTSCSSFSFSVFIVHRSLEF